MDSAATGTITPLTCTPVDHSGCFGVRPIKIRGNPNGQREGEVSDPRGMMAGSKQTLTEMIASQAAKEGNCYAVVSEAVDAQNLSLVETPSEGLFHIYTFGGDYVGTVHTTYDRSRATD